MLKKLTLTLILTASALAQTSVAPLDNPKMQFFSASGVPLAGGKVCTFSSGTTTPLTTYSEATGTSANTNPITLDSGGFATIFVTSSAIKLIVYSSVGADSNCPNAGVSQYTVDGIAPAKPVAPMSLTAIADPGVALGNFWLSTTNVGRIKYSDSGAIRTIVAADTTDTLTNKTIVAGTFTGTETHSGQIQSTIATGTAPFTIASTTTVPNLTVSNHPKVISCGGANPCSNTVQTSSFSVYDGGADYVLSGATLTVTGLPFTAANSYGCIAVDVTTGGNKVVASNNTGASTTFTGTGSDHFRFHCDGN